MSFGQPLLLLLLVAVPALLAAHFWQLRRRRRRAVRYSNVALLRAAMAGRRRAWRRQVPLGLVLASLALLGLAAARPQVRTDVPVSGTTILLALDVSGSMCATDVEPNRLTAAQGAVRTFVEAQPTDAKIGLVVFSGFAQVAVAPSTDRVELLTALDGVTTGRGTTIGAAILTAIDAISEIDPSVPPSDPVEAPDDSRPGSGQPPTPTPSPSAGGQGTAAPSGAADPVPEIVVLLTDGANTRGVTPAQAADQAAARGVRVYPIGFGTTNPTSLACSREQYGGFEPRRDIGFGGPGGSNVARSFLVVDEPTLRGVAETTGGVYFAATDAAELTTVLADLPRHVTTQRQDVDLSAGFAALAALLLVTGLGLSMRWHTLG